MKKIILALSLFIFLFLLIFNFVETEQNFNQPLIYTIEIDDDIKAGTSHSVKRAVSLAEKGEADYLIIKLNTPGGLIMPTREITEALLETEIKTIVFVNREGGWGFSAGTFILMAADYAVVHPFASIGAAQPIPADEKIISSMAVWMNALATANDRDGDFAERFVRENKTLTGSEAYEYKIINATAKNLDQLFVELKIENPIVNEIEISLFEKILNFLSNPFLMGLFLMIGTIGIIMALKTGELYISGFVSILFLALGAWGMGIINISLLGIILIILGLIMLGIELFAEPGFGLLGIVGTGIVILGVFSIEKEPFFEFEIWDPVVIIILGIAIAICILFIIIGKKTAEALKAKPTTGKESLIGNKVIALKDFDPYGIIETEGLKWTAKEINNKKVKNGDLLKIVELKGNTILVEKL